MLKKNPLVSVIIPTYGRSHLLRHAIESVLDQTYDNVEIIVVDDNDSTSEHRVHTEKSLQDYLKNNQITYLKHEKNAGGAAARNTGIKAAHGQYVALLDDDDEWFPQKLEKQITYFEGLESNVGVIYCSYILETIDGDKEFIRTEKGDLTKELLMLEFDPGASSTLVFRKDVLEKIGYFDENFARHQDLEVLIRLCRNYQIDVCQDVLLKINGHNFPSAAKSVEVKKLLFSTFEKEIYELGFWDKRKVFALHYEELSNFFFSERHMTQVSFFLLKAIMNDPRMLFSNEIYKRIKKFVVTSYL